MTDKVTTFPAIHINFLNHDDQRYPTCGDWWYTRSSDVGANNHQTILSITASKTKDSRSDIAVAIHELVEATLCRYRGIDGRDVDEFDIQWEASRAKPGALIPIDEIRIMEPGDDPQAPYYREHQIATTIERIIVEALGLTWHEHYKNVDEL